MSAHSTTFSSSPPKGTAIDWKSFLAVLPSGLDLVSPSSILHQMFELISNATDSERFARTLGDTQGCFRAAQLPIVIQEKQTRSSRRPAAEGPAVQRWRLGQLALQLYFTQLLHQDSALLDLWPSRFGTDESGNAIWAPRALYVRWEPSFLEAVRNVYRGFFTEDEAQFEAGIQYLNLGVASGALLRHLGEGDQGAVRFDSGHLQSTLQEIVQLRSKADPPLHPNFVAFGLYLASLYELLSQLDLAFDVRGAFLLSQAAGVRP